MLTFKQHVQLNEFTKGLKAHWKKHSKKYKTAATIAAITLPAGLAIAAAMHGDSISDAANKYRKEKNKVTPNTIRLKEYKQKLKVLERRLKNESDRNARRHIKDEIDFGKDVIASGEKMKRQRITTALEKA